MMMDFFTADELTLMLEAQSKKLLIIQKTFEEPEEVIKLALSKMTFAESAMYGVAGILFEREENGGSPVTEELGNKAIEALVHQLNMLLLSGFDGRKHTAKGSERFKDKIAALQKAQIDLMNAVDPKEPIEYKQSSTPSWQRV
jgi:hypothetical protein